MLKSFIDYNKDLKQRARELRSQMTEAEKKLWYEYLQSFPVQWYRQKILDNFIVDFYCPKLKLIIEVDGDSHFTEQAIEYDKQRTAILESYGLKVMRFTNDQVLNNFEAVVEEIPQVGEQIPPAPFIKGGGERSSEGEL